MIDYKPSSFFDVQYTVIQPESCPVVMIMIFEIKKYCINMITGVLFVNKQKKICMIKQIVLF